MHDTHILEGKTPASEIKKKLKKQISNLAYQPKIVIINISTDPAVEIYMRLKQAFAIEIGAAVEVVSPEVDQLSIEIERLNSDTNVHGIVIQLPLPDFVDTITTLESVAPHKDIDGLRQNAQFITADPRGIMELLAYYDIALTSKSVGLIGTGILIGRALQSELIRAGAQVAAFDLEHPIDPDVLRKSDIVIGATGVRGLLHSDYVSSGSLAIDASGVDFEPAINQRTDISLVPSIGGAGPMTVAALYENLLEAALQQE